MDPETAPEAAFDTLASGIGRRDLLRAATLVGAGATVPRWLTSPGVADAAAPSGGEPAVLQSGAGRVRGTYVRSSEQTVRWGFLPNRTAASVATVPSGAVVTVDTVSHEGILEDQGRDPVRYFGSKGVPASKVLDDAKAIAASELVHSFAEDGPHIVTGPVSVIGARPGDVLKIEVLGLVPRAPYGVISNRHGKGALPNELPAGPKPAPGASASSPGLYENVSTFTPVRQLDGRMKAVLPVSRTLRAEFPINPFMGMMGVALDTAEKVNSIPPTVAGGNIDIRDLTVGSTLYLPVFVPGAKFFVGDPHYAQGDGEVALTALEAPLRGTYRLTVLERGSKAIPGGRGTLDVPFGETEDFWLAVGLNTDLDEAMKQAVREAIQFLVGEHGMSQAVAYAYLSAATDFAVSQVVDRTKGVHARIRKSHFVPV